jgi:hypothetical protein
MRTVVTHLQLVEMRTVVNYLQLVEKRTANPNWRNFAG